MSIVVISICCGSGGGIRDREMATPMAPAMTMISPIARRLNAFRASAVELPPSPSAASSFGMTDWRCK